MFEISTAIKSDMPSWMELVRTVSRNFPGLETEEKIADYEKTLLKNINRQTAICAKENGKVVGILLFSTKYNMLCCMAVHPEYRQKGVASEMITEMLSKMDLTKNTVVTTFREGDEKGIAPRALYKKFGFVEEELTEEFGYPTQRFVLHAKEE